MSTQYFHAMSILRGSFGDQNYNYTKNYSLYFSVGLILQNDLVIHVKYV